jgi:hypothetical protein
VEPVIIYKKSTFHAAANFSGSIEATSQEKFSDINMSGFSSNFSGPKINSGRIQGVCHTTAVSPFSDDHQRQQISEKREILKLKKKIEERDECIMGLV